jgi:hypothetical protein
MVGFECALWWRRSLGALKIRIDRKHPDACDVGEADLAPQTGDPHAALGPGDSGLDHLQGAIRTSPLHDAHAAARQSKLNDEGIVGAHVPLANPGQDRADRREIAERETDLVDDL